MARVTPSKRKRSLPTESPVRPRHGTAVLDDVLAASGLTPGHDATILNWGADLPAASDVPNVSVVSPPAGTDDRLPYLDGTMDVVAIRRDNGAMVAEAMRVARRAVVRIVRDKRRNDLAIRSLWCAPPVPAGPSVSIVVPAYNGTEHVVGCLLALERTTPAGMDVEIIVVDDASEDETFAAIEFCAARDSRIVPVRNQRNLGFIGACHTGAALASNDILVFLNQDTVPLAGWLPALVSTFRTHERVGAVGARLLFPDGLVQEAGGVVFNDGTAANFGRGLDPLDPLVSYVREADYCSGAALATPRRLFASLGGFDTRYSPAYYEDTDYCMRVWQAGQRVLVQPASNVVHDEGSAHGTDPSSGGKRHQARNRHVFAIAWARELADCPAPPARYDLRTWHDLAHRDRSA